MSYKSSKVCVFFAAATIAAFAIACEGDTEDPTEFSVTCEGACDLNVVDFYRDGRNDTLENLLIEDGLGLATDELNDLLTIGDNIEAGIGFEEPKLHSPQELDTLVTGLMHEFGARELTTVVNQLRQNHLATTDDEVYAEAAFRIRGGLGYNWSTPLRGLDGDGSLSLGFDTGVTLESRVIAPFDSPLQGSLQNMLTSLKDSRYFILPRDMNDIIEMEPGELFAMSGSGRLGMHVGASVPIALLEPASVLTYRIVVGASLGTTLVGNLDIQLVRLSGNEVVVDVGMSRIDSRHARLTVHDSWGVSGLCSEWSLGSVTDDGCMMSFLGQEVDAADIVESALTKLLDRRLNLVDGRVERSSTESRMSVARMRFALDPADEEIVQALEQALRGDIRLAQALAMDEGSGVVAEFDLVRSGASTTSFAGLEFLGMNFFYEEIERTGTAVVQTPAGGMSLMFDSLDDHRGLPNTTWGYSRTGLAGLIFDATGQNEAESHANLLLQYIEVDEHQGHDDILDHIDATIFAMAGLEGLLALEVNTNASQRYIREQCGGNDPNYFCYDTMVGNTEVERLRNLGLSDFAAYLDQQGIRLADCEINSQTNTHCPMSQRRFLDQLAEARAMIQATGESVGSSKPAVNVLVEYRIDNDTLNELMTGRDVDQLRNAMIEYLRIADIDRTDDPNDIEEDRADHPDSGDSDDLDNAGEVWTTAMTDYRTRLGAEGISIQGQSLGANGIEIAYPGVDRDNVDVYEDAIARSLARARSETVTQAWDDLTDEIDFISIHDLGGMSSQSIFYGILSLLPADQVEVRVNISFHDMPDRCEDMNWQNIDLFYQGQNIDLLDGAQFDIDIDQIIN